MERKNKHTALSELKPFAFWVFFAPLFKIIECVCELAVPFLVRAIIDDGLTADGTHYRDDAFIYGLCLLIVALAVLGFACTMVTQYVAAKVSTDYAYALKKNIYAHLLSLSPRQVESFGRGKAVNLLGADSLAMQDGVLKFMRLLVRAPFLTLGAILASFIVNPYAGLVVAGALGLCGLLIFIILKITPSHYGKLSRDLDRLSQLGEEGIVGARVIRAFGKEEDAHRSFEAQSEAYRAQTLKISKINAFINPLTFALVNLAIVFLLYFGSFEFRTTALSVGSIVAIVSFLTQSLTALIQFTRLVTSLSKAVASKRRIDGFFALEPSLLSGEKKGLDEAKEGAPLYELRDVSLDFGGENPALSHVDFVLNEGETVGVIGGTGSGKSTLIGLLERFLDASDGTLLYRGHPIKEWDIPFLRGQIALVSQKPQIYKGTFRANLCLGNPSATKEQIEAAIDDSLCREFFPRLAKGLEEEIEENGQNLSGGQRQRLLIGRALASERPILILDDATSALDYKSDLRVRENLKKRQGLTTLLISQRATSIKGCDRIYVLDKGKVVGVGTHDELLLSCPIYAEIYQAQVDAR